MSSTIAPLQTINPEAAVAPGYLANHATRVFNRRVDAALRPLGLSMALLGPILLLSWKGPMRQRDLVQWSSVKQPAMVALLDKLEVAGWIERAPAPADRRAAMVALTEEGHRMSEAGGQALRDANALGVAGFSKKEVATLVGLLQRLITNLEDTAGTKHHE